MTTRRGRPRHPDILTPRQQEVLDLVREGLTNVQIGERLGISPDGAKFHVSEIITRLGVSTRHEAASWSNERSDDRPAASLRPLRRRASLHAGWRRLDRCRWRRVSAVA